MLSVFTITYILWILSEIVLNRLLRSKSTDKQNADQHSLVIIWITVVIAIFLAGYIATKYYLPIHENQLIRYIGLALVITGVIFRLIIVKSLGKYFTVDVTIKKDHKLKKDGFYSFLRHPSYFASLISFIGFGLSLNNWVSLSLVTLAALTSFIYRIKIEEKVLIAYFGAEYIAYQKTTKGIIPFIY